MKPFLFAVIAGFLFAGSAALAEPALDLLKTKEELKEEMVPPAPGKKEPIVVTQIEGIPTGHSELLPEVVRLGTDVSKILEAGVEGTMLEDDNISGGIYLKFPLDQEWYGLARTGVSENLVGIPDNASLGVGREFKSGAFIETRISQRKQSSGGICCSIEGTSLTINITTAF